MGKTRKSYPLMTDDDGIPRTQVRFRLFGVALVCVIAGAWMAGNWPGSFVVGVDEPRWVATGRYAFDRYFVVRDFTATTWDDRAFTRYGARNPPIGKFLFGASQVMAGVGDEYADRTNVLRFWKAATKIDRKALHVVRATSAVTMVVAAVALFVVAEVLTGAPILAALAAVFFVFDPFITRVGVQAMTEGPMMAFGLSILAATLFTARRARCGSIAMATVSGGAVGVLMALAVGTKLNALIFAAVAIAWAGLALLPNLAVLGPLVRGATTPAFCSAALAATLFGAFFWVLPNPHLWRAPVANTGSLLVYGNQLSEAARKPNNLMRLLGPTTSVSERVPPLIKFASVGPAAGLVRQTAVDGYIVTVGAAVWIAVLLGFSRMLPRSGAVLLLVWTAIGVSFQLIWTPFAWARYYFPMEPCYAIFEATAVFAAAKLAVSRLAPWLRRRESRPVSPGPNHVHPDRRAPRMRNRLPVTTRARPCGAERVLWNVWY